MQKLASSRAFRLPDLISPCKFPLIYHPSGDAVAAESDKWFANGCSNFTEEKRRHLSVLAAGKLSAFVYHDSSDDRLRCSCDFMNLIFHYGDLSDGLMINGHELVADIVMNAFWSPHAYRPTHARGKRHPIEEPDVSKLSKDLWLRCMRDSTPGFQARLLETLGMFFEGRNLQAKHRESGVIPTLEAYIDIRRDSSALKPLIDFLEYTLGIDFPDDVIDHPVMRSLKQSVNDFCSWSNDIFSFNKEQAYGDTYNMVIILMKVHGLSLQRAVDRVGEMCLRCLEEFSEGRRRLPKWGADIDKEVERYICGLESWMIGGLHWSFMSGRYFGQEGLTIKDKRLVKLLPQKNKILKDVTNISVNSP